MVDHNRRPKLPVRVAAYVNSTNLFACGLMLVSHLSLKV